ncbi:MAG TPA: hypothetical protein VGN48_08635 [Pedococcus sp.]|jgi:hypothetical protein|nr:hypothetical protein [Pedococcus sp.]
MSQQTATARVAFRAPQRRQPAPQELRVVPAAIGQPGNGLFAAACLVLLVAGLVSLLMLNTAMAEGSFTLNSLQKTSGELTDTQDALTQSLDAQRSPANLATRATRLGMVPADSAAFLRLSDGKVLGVASAAKAGSGFTVVTAPQTPSKAPAVAAVVAQPQGPKATVTTKGDVTTTTLVEARPDGSVVTTVTSVNAKTKATTSTTTTQPAATPTGGQPATATKSH